MRKDSPILNLLGIPPIQIGRQPLLVAPAASVAPMAMMINIGPLPETKVSSHF